MYFKEGYAKPKGAEQLALYGQSGEWFARAIKINPDYETAYRYWGSALMYSGKMDQALDKVVEAYVAMPYHKPASQGLAGWARMNNLKQLSHPRIEVPVTLRMTAPNKVNIALAPTVNADDGSTSWAVYGLERTAWMGEKFGKEYPLEKTYRHSLREEAAAFRAVIRAAQDAHNSGKVKQLDSSIANLIKLDKEGLLEAYVLLARPDQGIAQDYAAYRQANADKLRRYVRTYIMQRTN